MTMLTRRVVLAAALTLATIGVPAVARDESFTIAVLPDTQNYLDYTHQKAEGFPFDAAEMFMQQIRYVAANVESEGGDIAFVTSLGDIWQHQTVRMDEGHRRRGFKSVPNPLADAHFAPTPNVYAVEIPAARRGFELLRDKVPMSVVPGNHDYDAMWTDARFPPRLSGDPKDLSRYGMFHAGGLDNFRSVFGSDTPFFKDQPWYVASHDGGADNAQIFKAGGYRFLHIGLQFDAPNASLAWAASVIARYPGLPTIVTTHDYLNTEGERVANPMVDQHAADPIDNNPEMIWQKFISQHDQIFMVLCGHQHGAAMRVDTNRAGHKVYQLLSDYQGRAQTAIDAGLRPDWSETVGDGWLRLMTFNLSSAVPSVRVRTYSSHYGKFSSDTPGYAEWYKAQEHPQMTDEQFRAADDFQIDLTDFRARFGGIAR